MNNKRYGAIFKELRLQKGLSLSAFKELGISKTSLFNFEEGNTMMGFDRVNIALTKIGCSLANYEKLLNSYTPDYLENTVDKIEEAWVTQNVTSLKQIEYDLREKEHYIISLVSKGCYSSLSEVESEIIASYLYELTAFHYTEMNITFLSIVHLSQKDILFILEKLLKRQTIYFKDSTLRRKISEISLQAAYIFLSQDNQNGANYLINRLDNHFFTPFNLIIKNLISGCYEYKFVNRTTGEIKIIEALKIIKKICKIEIYNFYLKKVNELCDL